MSKEEEVKKIFGLHGSMSFYSDKFAKDLIALFSPLPVVGDLREKIIVFFWQLRTGAINTENMNLEEQDIFKADSILSFIKEAGYVKLDKKDNLPIPQISFPHEDYKFYYEQGRQDMVKEGWRKIA